MWKEFKKGLASVLAKFVPRAVLEQSKYLKHTSNDFAQTYYSQEGEEIILRRHFHGRNTGFFVDIGAHHPQKFSNTYKLYQLGWRGVNIDATPKSMEIFNLIRPKDINLEYAISNVEEELTFYEFDEGALNTFSKEKVDEILSETNFKLKNTIRLKTVKLERILDKHLPTSVKIDFFSIDAEGFDLNILKGNNWDKYKPEVIVVETNTVELAELKNDELVLYLSDIGYAPFAKTYKTLFFKIK